MKGVDDIDCATWSSQGKLFQIDYAKKAVEHGGLTLGIRSKTHGVVLCTIKRNPNSLATYQDKTFKVDSSMGMAISGLTADARVIYKYMKRETNNHIHQFGIPIPSKSLMDKVARKFQSKTYTTGTRPYGVGLLIAYYDGDEPHLYEITPAGDLFEYFAYSLGQRAQSARTYFENNLGQFDGVSLDDLILHGLKALHTGNGNDEELNEKNIEVAQVGEEGFKLLKPEEIKAYLDKLPKVTANLTQLAASSVMQEEK